MGVENFENYLPRARRLAPNFPVCVLRQWIYRHFDDAVHDYGWLGFRGLNFRKENWSTNAILEKVKWRTGRDLVPKWAFQLRNNAGFRRSWLGTYMIEHGTWPAPILVIDNKAGLRDPRSIPLGIPHHLLEGHHRLAYLYALVDDSRGNPQDEHDLWIIDVEPSDVLDHWPMS